MKNIFNEADTLAVLEGLNPNQEYLSKIEDHLVNNTVRQRVISAKLRDAKHEKKLPDMVDRAFRVYQTWCQQNGFPMRETEFLKRYPFAKPLIAKDYGQGCGWESFVAYKCRRDAARAKL